MIRRMLFAGMLLVATACASGGGARSTYQRDLITETELKAQATQYANLYDVVSGLRPNWLRGPLTGSGIGSNSVSTTPVVWLDGREFGEVEMLKQLAKDSAVQLRYYTATAGQGKFGMREARPVIEITTRGR